MFCLSKNDKDIYNKPVADVHMFWEDKEIWFSIVNG